jgi:glycosyltransferase involved in cell wall biosynthesis
MLRTIGEHAKTVGWPFSVVLPREAEGREWLADLEEFPVHFTSPAEASELLDALTVGAETAIIHSHFTTFDRVVAAQARKHPNVLAFWHIHTAMSTTWKVRLRNTFRFGYLGRDVAAVLCVAPNILARVRARGGRRAEYFPNAVDPDEFRVAAAEARREARLALGLAPDDTVLLHFGRDWEIKGGELALQALQQLPSNMVLVTVGAPEAAERRAGELGIEDRVTTIPPRNDVSRLYAAADVFVSSSPAEGMPYSVLEAMSSGLSTVLTDIPGHVAVSMAPNCTIVGATAAEIAAGISTAVAQGRPGAASHAWVVEHAGLSSWADRLMARYQVALRGVRPPLPG